MAAFIWPQREGGGEQQQEEEGRRQRSGRNFAELSAHFVENAEHIR